MTYETWPFDSLTPSQPWWRISAPARRQATSGGTTAFTLKGGGGLWLCDMVVPLLDEAMIKRARSLVDGLRGGSIALIVPTWEAPFAPGISGTIAAYVALSAPLRATDLSIRIDAGDPLIGGERFSITHGAEGKRLYQVLTAEEADESGIQACTIAPPLRAAVSAEALDFNDPACLMRCVNTDEAMTALRPGLVSDLNIKFEEAFEDA